MARTKCYEMTVRGKKLLDLQILIYLATQLAFDAVALVILYLHGNVPIEANLNFLKVTLGQFCNFFTFLLFSVICPSESNVEHKNFNYLAE